MQDPNPPRKTPLQEPEWLHWSAKRPWGFPAFGKDFVGGKGRFFRGSVSAFKAAYGIYTFGGATKKGALYRVHIYNQKIGDWIELAEEGSWGFSRLDDAKQAAQDYHDEFGQAGITPDDCKAPEKEQEDGK